MNVGGLGLKVFRIHVKDQFKYGLVAFMIPLLVRMVPEVFAGPYPIGLDTLRYVRAIVEGWALRLAPLAFLKSTNLFYVMATGIHGLFGVDAFFLMKALGPLMDGVLGFLIFAYARYVLRWGYRKSVLSSALAAVYFISLIISGSYYRQVLGLIFFMAALVSLNGFKSPYRYVATLVFVVLAVLSHEMVAVLLLFIFGVEALSHLLKRDLRDFTYLTAITWVAASLFLFQRYSPSVGTISIPFGSTVYESSTGAASQVLGFIGYSYVLIIPLAILGFRALKDKTLLCWVIFCLGVSIIPMLSPQASVVFWRWVYLLVYPLAFCAAEGVEKLLSIKTGKNPYRQAAKVASLIFMLSLILVPSTFYLFTYPEEPFPYFAQYNPYLMYVPSSMLQNAVSIKDNPSVVRCFEWLNENMDNGSMLVTHEVMNEFAALYLQGEKSVKELVKLEITRVAEEALAEEMVKAAEKAVADGWSKVYTVWWVDGKGWYGMPQLPPQFVEIQRFGNMGVFQYVRSGGG
jgi:hypothetical protein